jgi:hypothetical protein
VKYITTVSIVTIAKDQSEATKSIIEMVLNKEAPKNVQIIEIQFESGDDE